MYKLNINLVREYDFIDSILKKYSLVRLCDSESCCDTFCDDIGILYESLKNAGWTFFFLFHCCGKRYICEAYP